MVQLSLCKHPPQIRSYHIASLMLHFQPTDQSSRGECCIVLENRLTGCLIANPWQRLSLAVCEIHAVNEERCRQGYEPVCANLYCWMLWHLKCIRIIAAMHVSSGYNNTNCETDLTVTTQEFRMVGGYMENLAKPQNCQNWWVGACMEMDRCLLGTTLIMTTSRKTCGRTLFINMCTTTFQSHV